MNLTNRLAKVIERIGCSFANLQSLGHVSSKYTLWATNTSKLPFCFSLEIELSVQNIKE